MQLEYVISARTNGANPFKIWDCLNCFDEDNLAFVLRRMSYPLFLKSAYWFAVSMKAKANAGMRCQVCNGKEGIEVHHRTYDTHGKEHLNMNDLVVLDSDCHSLFHGHKPIPYKKPRLCRSDETRGKVPAGFVMPHTQADIVPPPDGDQIVLTYDLVQACRANGSFTNATLRALGMRKSLIVAGWPMRLIGKVISREQFKEAQEGRFIYKSGPLEP